MFPALRLLVGITSQTQKTQNCPALQPGCFSAARPVGRLSFAASAAVGGGLFAGEEALCQLAPDAVCLLRRDLAGLE